MCICKTAKNLWALMEKKHIYHIIDDDAFTRKQFLVKLSHTQVYFKKIEFCILRFTIAPKKSEQISFTNILLSEKKEK